jgi:hypothetical protein
MKKIKKATQEIIDNMEKTMVSTVKFYRDMQEDEIYAKKYSDENLKLEIESMAKAYNMLLANQYNILGNISKLVWYYETMIEVEKIEKQKI